MRRLLCAMLAATWLSAGLPAPAMVAAQATCTLDGAFTRLQSAIPGIAGECIAPAASSPQGVYLQQRTTTGMFAWRQSDNWLGFTDWTTVWLMGPCGLQSRAWNDRFAWELGGTCDEPPVLGFDPTPAPGPDAVRRQLAAYGISTGATATPSSAATPAPGGSPIAGNRGPAAAGGLRCSDFANQAEAEGFYLGQGGPDSDPYHLDRDGNGIACDEAP